MADIPQEVREAAARLAEAAWQAFEAGDYTTAIAHLAERDKAMFIAGKRAGMERAAQIAEGIYPDDDWLDRDDAANGHDDRSRARAALSGITGKRLTYEGPRSDA